MRREERGEGHGGSGREKLDRRYEYTEWGPTCNKVGDRGHLKEIIKRRGGGAREQKMDYDAR